MPLPPHGPTSHTYFSQRLRLHYVDWGNEGAPPMLMVHGGRDHCRNWDWVAQELRKDYHIIAPDLRGHGDSQWMVGGTYNLAEYVYDIAQLLDQTGLKPVTILAHSLGGMVSNLYAGLYPDNVKKLVTIEGLGMSPQLMEKREAMAVEARLDQWVGELKNHSARLPRRYASLDDAVTRMRDANPHLNEERARHLTIHGVLRNEDGTYSWKFDNYVRSFPPYGFTQAETHRLWERITCPVLMFYGSESEASDPRQDGRLNHFKNARVDYLEQAGHWVHHDRHAAFIEKTRAFLTD